MSSSYSSLDWVLSHWVHFTVHSLDLVVFICVYFVLFSYCIYVVLLSAQWGGPNGIEAWSLGLLFLQCFDTVGWVFWPIKPVPDMTYNVFGGTLNLAQLTCIYERQNVTFGRMLLPYKAPPASARLPVCCRWADIYRWATAEIRTGGRAPAVHLHTRAMAGHGGHADGCQLQLELRATGYWLVLCM